jgi:hypothetical protein
MMSGRISKRQSTSSPVRTQKIVDNLKRLSDGWGGTPQYKKPASKAVRKITKVLATLETGRMPFPTINAIGNGGIVLTWVSLTRDILLTIDPDGDIQFITSLKKIDAETFEIVERLDSEGAITDMLAIDHMMAWYAMDKAAKC